MPEIVLNKCVFDVRDEEGSVFEGKGKGVGDNKVELVNLSLLSVSWVSGFPFGKDVLDIPGSFSSYQGSGFKDERRIIFVNDDGGFCLQFS